MKIELDVYPKENKYGMFINISEKNESCYKIYFGDNKEEVKRKYLTKKDNVKKIKIIINYKIKSLSKLFKDRIFIKKINFIKFRNKNIINMNYMFSRCTYIIERFRSF